MKLFTTTKAVLTLGISAALLGVGAAPANAATVDFSKRHVAYSTYGGVTMAQEKFWVDYNRFEEIFLGKRDGYKHYGKLWRVR